MDRVRVAVIGVSHWHAPLYLDALARRPGLVQVVAVTDRDEGLARRVARRFSARAAPDVRSLGDLGMDLAIVLGRHDHMASVAAGLMARGVPMVLEKPGALNLDELDELVERARELRAAVAVPLVHRYAPFAQVLRAVPEPRYLRLSYLVGSPSRYPTAGCEWMLFRESGGGVLANLGPHFVDLARLLGGDPVRLVHASGRHALHALDIEDQVVIELETPRGFSATIDLGYVLPGSERYVSMTLAGSGGFASVGADGGALMTDADGITRTTRIDVDSDVLFDDFVRRSLDALPRGLAGLPDLSDLRAAMAVIDDAYEAAAGRRGLTALEEGGRAWAR